MTPFESFKQHSRQWPLDFVLLGLIGVLLVLGVTMVASSSVAISQVRFNDPNHYLLRQVMAIGIGAVAAAIVFRIPLTFWENQRGKLFLLAIFLLIAVLIFGREINGSKRWLPLGVMNFQPSEFMKLVVVIFMAGYLNKHVNAVKESFEAVLRLALPFGLMAILLLLEPDYGSTLVIAVLITGMLLVAGAPWRYFVLTVLPIVTVLGVLIVNSEYRMQRVATFLDPWQDPFGSGYQLTQALMALGSGDWLGSGLGASIQKLLYLPDAHTDFLFSIYAEEFGFIGVLALIILYLAILHRMFRMGHAAIKANLFFGGMIVYGVAIWIILQAGINIGVNLGAFPTKGLTLPFMSYGGSSVLIFSVALGLAFRVDYETRCHPPEQPKDTDSANHNTKAPLKGKKRNNPGQGKHASAN